METQQFYNWAKYYDVSFTRDLEPEFAFFQNCFKQYSKAKVNRLLEVACGTGTYVRKFAEAGYDVTAYDLNSHMVAYTKEQLKGKDYEAMATVFEGDMKNTVVAHKCDAAMNLLSSIGYMQSDADAISHFTSMSKSLRPGAPYILELSFACADFKNEKTPDETWFYEKDGIKVESTWRPDYYNVEKKIRHVCVSMKVNDHGQECSFNEEHNLRLWLWEDFVNLAGQGGFAVKAVYNQKFEKLPEGMKIVGESGGAGGVYVVIVNSGKPAGKKK